jgi:hypothetical protein
LHHQRINAKHSNDRHVSTIGGRKLNKKGGCLMLCSSLQVSPHSVNWLKNYEGEQANGRTREHDLVNLSLFINKTSPQNFIICI